MAAATVYSNLFNSSGVPVPPNPLRVPAGGVQIVPVTQTIAVTSIDDIGDFIALWPIHGGRIPVGVLLESGTDMDTHATPTLDLDIVLRTIDKNGTVTDVQLLNGGAGTFAAALADQIYLFPGAAPVRTDDADMIGLIGLYAVAAAATGAEGTVKAALIYR